MPEKLQISRAEYLHLLPLPTRWMDNDIYGHINNALYYAFFDTAINQYLIAKGGLDIVAGPVVAFAVESQCQYLRPLRYELAVFEQEQDFAAAVGYFVHVFVNRETQLPVTIPSAIRMALEALRLRKSE